MLARGLGSSCCSADNSSSRSRWTRLVQFNAWRIVEECSRQDHEGCAASQICLLRAADQISARLQVHNAPRELSDGGKRPGEFDASNVSGHTLNYQNATPRRFPQARPARSFGDYRGHVPGCAAGCKRPRYRGAGFVAHHDANRARPDPSRCEVGVATCNSMRAAIFPSEIRQEPDPLLPRNISRPSSVGSEVPFCGELPVRSLKRHMVN